ncbi:nitrate reductase molybdenum cofactor assembly chaperone [Rhodococcus chondri]|uniref:Nitrate reductase molybdenum cofactor assembly chaperone n=1 Tax=Rhodococcus chondri TaxID=3065941 RepID=A0ABU7JLW9_9NOCA|nr:nitrate reductase molybdenum cofactor assembly chaperone [Rhodococcus sp. CC-R104]MEE2031046.1 nitrate reductase molybdenum cofactor assembly chaperone [Rhodococcus sp. CC-R104]
MKLLRRPSRRDTAARQLQHRLIRQSASLLLAYPDEQLHSRLDIVDRLLDHIDGPEREQLARTAAHLRRTGLLEAEQDYVATFDMRRRSTMYLTYWTGGDTRNRGTEIHAFVRAYLEAGAEPPVGEAPDHLPVVLEFAATVAPEVGEQLLAAHRIPLDVLHGALVESESVYADTIAAVCATLPSVSDQQQQHARQLAQAGPPAEAIGLQPFTLTVPPRKDEQSAREGDL